MNYSAIWGYLTMELRRRYARAQASDDLGASAIEWVIITGILVAIAVAVGAILFGLINDEADSIVIPDAPGGP
ncbi:hypothetical protein [Cellulomonas sp. URHE0023]|uniref:hypothetical protein n=1 Tax=Cellulomonas sp. URHE0023 TaxID=1380354 RepID=UPI000486EF8C|nr:hypothetical protein [Cellulomonas sp. URHE0023]